LDDNSRINGKKAADRIAGNRALTELSVLAKKAKRGTVGGQDLSALKVIISDDEGDDDDDDEPRAKRRKTIVYQGKKTRSSPKISQQYLTDMPFNIQQSQGPVDYSTYGLSSGFLDDQHENIFSHPSQPEVNYRLDNFAFEAPNSTIPTQKSKLVVLRISPDRLRHVILKMPYSIAPVGGLAEVASQQSVPAITVAHPAGHSAVPEPNRQVSRHQTNDGSCSVADYQHPSIFVGLEGLHPPGSNFLQPNMEGSYPQLDLTNQVTNVRRGTHNYSHQPSARKRKATCPPNINGRSSPGPSRFAPALASQRSGQLPSFLHMATGPFLFDSVENRGSIENNSSHITLRDDSLAVNAGNDQQLFERLVDFNQTFGNNQQADIENATGVGLFSLDDPSSRVDHVFSGNGQSELWDFAGQDVQRGNNVQLDNSFSGVQLHDASQSHAPYQTPIMSEDAFQYMTHEGVWNFNEHYLDPVLDLAPVITQSADPQRPDNYHSPEPNFDDFLVSTPERDQILASAQFTDPHSSPQAPNSPQQDSGNLNDTQEQDQAGGDLDLLDLFTDYPEAFWQPHLAEDHC
jgi:hypothetical protein